nr:hypothetical protein Iba_chr10aCG1200 [Ipomoea batatas]GMD41485.1 hypothetical protein Iba_chr10bCG0140 [Ipomoea batatas]
MALGMHLVGCLQCVGGQDLTVWEWEALPVGTHRQCGISLLTPAVTRWITCRSMTQSTNCFWRMKEKTHEMDVIMCIVWDGTLQSLIFHVPDLSNS